MELNLDTILILISTVLGILATIFGLQFNKIKSKLTGVVGLGKEAFDVVNAAVSALDDNKITPEEIEKIKKEALEVKVAWRTLLGKDAQL